MLHALDPGAKLTGLMDTTPVATTTENDFLVGVGASTFFFFPPWLGHSMTRVRKRSIHCIKFDSHVDFVDVRFDVSDKAHVT